MRVGGGGVGLVGRSEEVDRGVDQERLRIIWACIYSRNVSLRVCCVRRFHRCWSELEEFGHEAQRRTCGSNLSVDSEWFRSACQEASAAKRHMRLVCGRHSPNEHFSRASQKCVILLSWSEFAQHIPRRSLHVFVVLLLFIVPIVRLDHYP